MRRGAPSRVGPTTNRSTTATSSTSIPCGRSRSPSSTRLHRCCSAPGAGSARSTRSAGQTGGCRWTSPSATCRSASREFRELAAEAGRDIPISLVTFGDPTPETLHHVPRARRGALRDRRRAPGVGRSIHADAVHRPLRAARPRTRLTARIQRVREGFTGRSGVRIRYLDNAPVDPVGPPILLSPGFTDYADEYVEVLEFLSPRRVLVVEVRGRGGSEAPATGYAAARSRGRSAGRARRGGNRPIPPDDVLAGNHLGPRRGPGGPVASATRCRSATTGPASTPSTWRSPTS